MMHINDFYKLVTNCPFCDSSLAKDTITTMELNDRSSRQVSEIFISCDNNKCDNAFQCVSTPTNDEYCDLDHVICIQGDLVITIKNEATQIVSRGKSCKLSIPLAHWKLSDNKEFVKKLTTVLLMV